MTTHRSRVALVTGGAGGVGTATCRALASAGHHVVVVDLNEEAAQAVAENLRDEGFGATGVACDVSNPSAVDDTRDLLLDDVGVIDVVVNLAGVTRNAPLLKVTDEDFDLVLNTHVRSTLNTLRTFAPAMKEQQHGRFVNTSSIAVLGSPAGSSYGAAKGAIEGLTRSAALELARHGVTVNCVAPGLVDTGMFLDTPDSFRLPLLERIPMHRFADPAEIADCIAFLASPASSYLTGQSLFVTGGLDLAALA